MVSSKKIIMAAADLKEISDLIREKAFELGFDLFGIAQTEVLTEHGEILKRWCDEGMQSDMNYLGKDIARRINPALLFPGAKSVIVTGLNYYTEKRQGGNGVPVFSRYAYGMNYHDVLLGRLGRIVDYIKVISPGANGKSYVDSAPLLEKAWARKAGLGWPGRHSILINKEIGSFFFLGVILTDLELEYNKSEIKDHCGSCRQCIDACPTNAINGNRTIDTRRCLAYLTIEDKLPIKDSFIPKMEGRVFGCDICQEACPWNKHAKQHTTPEFDPFPELIEMSTEEWRNLSKEKFRSLFKKSAVGRKKYETFIRNVTNVTNSNNPY